MRSLGVAPGVRFVWEHSRTTPWAFPAVVLYNIQLGLVLLLGGADRITGPSFATVREFGGTRVGWAFLVLGVAYGASAFVSPKAMLWIGVAAGVAHLVLACGFLAPILHEPPAAPGLPHHDPTVVVRPALTGPGTYLLVAVVHFFNGLVYGQRGPLGKAKSA